MVNISDVRASNAQLKSSPVGDSLVAVFVGATSGIGMGTLKQFAKQTKSPKAYIAVRSIKAATPLLKELQASNPQGSFLLRETEVSLMKNVDKICDEIKENEEKVDLVYVSPGYLAFGARNETVEGIDIPHALRYYSRLRFIWNLLSLLLKSPNPRVISILAGGKESPLDLNDLEMRNDFDTMKAMSNGTTQTTLAFEKLAKEYPTISFIHKFPGFVNTGVLANLMDTAKGLYKLPALVVKYALLPIINLFSMSVDEAGERVLYLATSARYPPSKHGEETGVPLGKVSLARDSDEGNGVYLLGGKDESGPNTPALVQLREEGGREKVWESTVGVWERALERSA